MKKSITITRQDGEKKSVSAVIGEAVIGRALIANCRDERISRRHGLITVSSDGKVILTPRERMYYIQVGQAKRKLLHRGATLVLSDGDRFSFLPQRFCFQIKIADVLKGEERKRKSRDVLEREGMIRGQRGEEEVTTEEPKRMKLQNITKPQPSTSTGDDDGDDQQEMEQKQQSGTEIEDSDSNTQDQNKQSIDDIIPETREKMRISSFNELPDTEKSRSSASVGEEDDGQEEQSAKEKPSKVEKNDVSDINQRQRGYDEEEADIVYPETGVPGNKHKTNTEEGTEDQDHQNEANQPMSSSHFVFGPSSNLKPLEEFWSRGIISAPINSGEPKVDKPRYPEENLFQEDDYRPLCPHGKTCFNLTPKHRQDFRHDVPEPQTKSNTSSQ